MQLHSIHAFLKGEEQVPLIFVFMSRKRKRVYKKVMQCIKRIIPEVKLPTSVADFEASFWKAVRSVFPDITIKGCSFHRRQAVWRKADSLGLRVPYLTSGAIHSYVTEILALSYVPAEHMKTTFEKLSLRAELADPEIQEPITYVKRTWIESSLWSPDTWSVFNMSVRANRDVEGWHRRLNSRGHAKVHLYKLIEKLQTEALLVPVHVQLAKRKEVKALPKETFQEFAGSPV